MKKTIIELNEWNSLVIRTYKRPYSLQQQNGCLAKYSYVTIEVPNENTDKSIYGAIGNGIIHDDIPEVVNGDQMCVKLSNWLARDPNFTETGLNVFELELFWHRNFYPDVDVLANDLYKKGLLKEGVYVILIDW